MKSFNRATTDHEILFEKLLLKLYVKKKYKTINVYHPNNMTY